MKLRIALLGTALCLASFAQLQKSPDQTANRMKRTVSVETVVGCVDQRNDRYVVRDVQSGQLLTLIAPGTDGDGQFAKYVGHKVEAIGAKSSASLGVTSIRQIADMCGPGVK